MELTKVSASGKKPFISANMSTVVLLNHLEEKIRTYSPVDGTNNLLPTMDAGYRIHLRSVTEAPSPEVSHPDSNRPASLPIPEIQLPEYAASHSDTEMKTGHERALSLTAKDVEPPKKIPRALLLPLFVLLLLVPGFLLFVGHVRNGINHDNRTSERDQYLSTIGREGDSLEGLVDVVGLEPLQPAVPVADNLGGIAKCEGWRDWLDYGSGWKGCVP